MNKLAPRFAPIPTLGALLLLAACGGNVVVDHNSSGSGGSGAGATGGFGGVPSTGTFPSTTGDVNPVTGSTSTLTGTGGFPDGPGVGPGVGGAGGISPVGTGPQQCNCTTFCKAVEDCFPISDQQCQQACSFIPTDAKQCVCDASPSCDKIQQCVMMGTGPGAGGAQPGTGGFPPVGVGVGGFPPVGVGVGGGSAVSTGVGGGIPATCSDCANQAFAGPCAMQAQDCGQHNNCVNLIQCEDQCNFEPNCVQMCKSQFPHNVNRADALLECAVCNQCTSECASSQVFTTVCIQPD